jgi:hypothetical protein
MKTSDSWPLNTVALLGGISILPSTSIFSVTFDVTAENHNSLDFDLTIQSKDIHTYIYLK